VLQRLICSVNIELKTGIRVPERSSSPPVCFSVQTYSAATRPFIQRVPKALSIGLQRPSHEADHSHPSTTEV